jgi:hypothetical protein
LGSPVDVPHLGPITAFLNYTRLFDAPPIDTQNIRYAITASCGIRRDRLPAGLRFDEGFTTAAGEDVEFGYAARDQGISTQWIQAPPVLHMLSEDLSQFIERFMRYGRASSQLSSRFGRWEEGAPDPEDMYSSLLNERYVSRSYSEVCDDRARMCFSLLDTMAYGCWLVGYLVETLRGEVVVSEDARSALASEWGVVLNGDTQDGDAACPTPWEPPITADVARLTAPPAHVEIGRVTRSLRALIPTADESDRVSVRRPPYAERLERLWAAEGDLAKELWHDAAAQAEGSYSMATLGELLRSMGISYKDGVAGLEAAAQAATQDAGVV